MSSLGPTRSRHFASGAKSPCPAQPPRTPLEPRCPVPFAKRSRDAAPTSTCANSEACNRLRLCTKMTISYEGIACYSPCAMNMWSISSRLCFNCTVFGTDKPLRRSNSLFLHNLSSILYTATFPTPAFAQTSVPNWRAFVPAFPISYPVCLASHLV